jgi:hypothetical protein
MTKKLSDSMAWAAASVPFELLKGLPKKLEALKTTLDGFHDAPTGIMASVSRDEKYTYNSVGDKRWKVFKAAFDEAKRSASNASSGLLSASLINGPLPIREVVNSAHTFASAVDHGMTAIDRTLSGSIFNADGILESEHSGALCVAASRMLTVTIAEIEAHIAEATRKTEEVDTSAR